MNAEGRAAYHAPVSAGGRAWIVDDSALEASFAARALVGWQCEVFAEGSAMLERLAAGGAPEVLIVDWQMPGLSGVEICEYLRSNPATASLPILLLTVQSQTRDVVEGLRAGADDYVKKPYHAEELIARVEALVRSSRLRSRAEEAEATVSMLLRHLPDALLILDDSHTVVFANETAKRALDDAARPLVGARLDDVLPEMTAAVDGRLALAPDVRIQHRIYAPVVGTIPGVGRVQRTIALRDVTEERGIEARRLDFYSIVAHDLRTPLSALMLRSENLVGGRRGELADASRHEVEQMQLRIKQMAELVDDFLDLARVDAAGMRIDRAPVDLAALVADAVTHMEAVAEEARLTLTFSRRSDVAIVGDSRRLRQVITNLLSNAIKFSLPGGAVDVTLDRAGDASDRCEVAVVDTGRGISADALPILFQRYARAVDSRSVAGTGLGLMIVRQVIEAHQGTVGVESREGLGSRFWFRLPVAPNP